MISLRMLHTPPYYMQLVIGGFYFIYLFIYKVIPIGNVTFFILTVPSSLMVTSFQRSSICLGTVIEIKFVFLTKLYCLHYTRVFYELLLLDYYFVRN